MPSQEVDDVHVGGQPSGDVVHDDVLGMLVAGGWSVFALLTTVLDVIDCR